MIYRINHLKKVIGSKSIVILGKGPSLNEENYSNIPDDKIKVSINQVIMYYDADLSFFIDMEPLLESMKAIEEKRTSVIIPYFLNERVSLKKAKPMKIDFFELMKIHPQLKKLTELVDFYLFDSGLGNRKYSDLIFRPNFTSTTSLLKILFTFSPLDHVYGIGFDGGNTYAKGLDLRHKITQVSSFNNQFDIFKEIERNYNKRFIKMSNQTINIYVGATPAQKIATKVLEYSILKYSSINVNVFPLYEALGDRTEGISGGTSFSMQRLFIPELNNHEGIAIYLDSDMLVFDDIKKLVDSHDPEKILCSCPAPPNSGRRDQYSVFTVDCSRARWNVEELLEKAQENYKEIMFSFSFEESKAKSHPWIWNSLEQYDEDTKLIHFTDMDKQPWLNTNNPNKKLWLDALCGAVRNNFISREDVLLAVKQDDIRPGVLDYLDNKNSFYVRFQDLFFLPHHTLQRFPAFNKPVLRNLLAILISVKRILNRKYDK